ncbi:GH25 family lysozyme [Saccharothrix sp. NPDC042600]|uniref:GH25 family lysozyme n=1 Tax=Saccharothrix TaxID=2071 RepID=UPI0033D81B10|nr:GH25 family lysozyme [Saccharothrix mutabilis subsp. capreolus]
MTDYGIDISSHQGDRIDWPAVAGHNITFASVKTTEGTTYTNPLATNQVNGARSVGIMTGGYHYAHPGDIAGQVGYFAASLQARGLLDHGSMWPMLDMEAGGFGDPNPFIAEFISRFRAATGTPLLVYANQNWFTTRLRPDEWADEAVLLWVAQYNGNPARPDYAHPRLVLHQHSEKGNVNGFPGLVDRNATMDGWDRSAFAIGSVPAPAPGPQPPAPAPAPSGWVDYTIVWGDTLSALAVRFGTTVAELAAVNGIPNPDRIQAGQVIRVPVGVGGGGERYQIQPGDTLSALAVRWGTTVAAIAARNGISNPDRIYAGDWITRP